MSAPLEVDGPEITVDLVTDLITAQFPQWGHLPIQPVDVGGWDNRTFRLGEELTVRLPSAQRYAAAVDKEHRWLPVFAPRVPLPVPVPVALGQPNAEFPYPWSVRRWLPGQPTTPERISSMDAFAVALADFLRALACVDPAGGPEPGPHNFWRGGPLDTYAEEPTALSTASATPSRGRTAWPRGRLPRQPPGDRSRCGSMATSPPGTCSSSTASLPQ